MENIKKGTKVIIAAMVGSLVGGVMGLLLAPKSGQELRQDLTGQANKLGDKAVVIREKARSAWQNVEDKTQVPVNTGKSWIQKGKGLVSNLKPTVSDIQQDALTKTSSINASEDKDSSDPTQEI
ncbi:YtxH domain-containing protein [Desulfosporosinus sp. Sb-LF]|uniref:YtxH domain-containing protein n=1 Tax=Desulfosporosinus sp. Sb-LF TaxID=2560027 RepID=UPI00107F55AB|nr:YtxH domain-containing protein [Desulfosporosinus sp. Sb-LF]TGE33413.1 YtxH domain-containing protein [Desulfosporosinus sp. Sb-LF]